ncbi:PepSY domain-containing protein [Alkalicoccobacillus porphyridii]|uniref:PepSY domain-containing protein n=1 Tax=Alkalicoccobacillus porphyridii TaxID=2597270 RepID=A0A553ZTC5_9BACI|nr:PepSY domain-containing protein [Alkalicoccobacillus porphyridii]TSB44712.1 hypothetical protein FN960_19955 [Alkalicoccobacillus porphyridii]
MKKPLALTLVGLLTIGGTSAALASTATTKAEADPVLTAQNANSPISEQEAKKIAEAFIGGKVTDIEKDFNDGALYYEVEVDLYGEEFDVDISEENGQIVDTDGNLLKTNAASAAPIAPKEAESAAKQAVDLDTIIQTELEVENAQFVYEVEFNVHGDGEDVKVSGETGEILSIDDDFNINPSGDQISAEEAKAIAIKEVGEGAKVTEVDLDTDDGISIYEIELNLNGTEYDVDLDANTKEVLKVEKD